MPLCKRPAGATGLVALEMIKRARVEKQPGMLAGVPPQAQAGRASERFHSPVAKQVMASAERSSKVAKKASESGQRGTKRATKPRNAPPRQTPPVLRPRQTPLLASTHQAPPHPILRHAKPPQAPPIPAVPGQREDKKAAADFARRIADEKERAEVATKKIIAADARAAAAEREATLLQERVQELVTSFKEASAALVLVEKKISYAEGKAEVLGEQAQTAAQALERAARAEERSAVMCDLQTKLPVLIRAVTGSLAKEGWPVTQNMFPDVIKLEYEDDRHALADTNMVSDSTNQQPSKCKHHAVKPSLSQVAGSGVSRAEPATFKTPNHCTKTGVMQPAVTAITGGGRQLKI